MSQSDRELARELLSGKASIEEVKARRSSAVPPVQAAPAVQPPPVEQVEERVEKQPVMTNAPEQGRKFPCKQCGARLDFDPTQRALKCPYCGFVEEIAPAKVQVTEKDLLAALNKVQKDHGVIAGRSNEVRCGGCGANVLLEDKIVTDRCPFCATHLDVTKVHAAEGMICPEYLMPFKVSQRESVAAFNAWLASRWFAPSDLKQLANLGQLSGVYMPFWTYDAMTYSHYTGMRGDDYWVTESYTTMENGRSVRRTRQVRRTRWTYVSGEVDHFFDDVLVCASKSVPREMVDGLEPWHLAALEGFRAEYLAGFKTERYAIGLDEGFGIARGVMDAEIRRLCERDIGGDHQRVNSVNTQHVGVTYKHVLLPVWLAVYRYHDKTFRIMVNARTGEVVGTRPYSWVKITLLVLGIIAVIATIAAIVASQQ